jgi:hypothetical protein
MDMVEKLRLKWRLVLILTGQFGAARERQSLCFLLLLLYFFKES